MIPALKIARNNSEVVNTLVKARIGQISLFNVREIEDEGTAKSILKFG